MIKEVSLGILWSDKMKHGERINTNFTLNDKKVNMIIYTLQLRITHLKCLVQMSF